VASVGSGDRGPRGLDRHGRGGRPPRATGVIVGCSAGSSGAGPGPGDQGGIVQPAITDTARIATTTTARRLCAPRSGEYAIGDGRIMAHTFSGPRGETVSLRHIDYSHAKTGAPRERAAIRWMTARLHALGQMI